MGTHIHYTHRQACHLLGIDGKTFNKWLEAAGMELQADPRDGRARRITRTQLQRLADRHGKVLPDDDAVLREDIDQAKSLAALTWEVEQLAQGLEQVTVLVQRNLESQERLLSQVQELLTEQSRQILDGVGSALREQSTQLSQRTEQLSEQFRQTREDILKMPSSQRKDTDQERIP